MMSFLLVVKAELVRTWIVMRRYWFRTVTGMAISYGMLIMFIIGFVNRPESVDVPANFADAGKATNWALGFIIGMFAFGVVGMFSQGLQTMAQSGQLEQLCMSPHGLVTNFMARTVVGSISNILSSAVLLWLISRTFHDTLHATDENFLPMLILLTLTFANVLGFGFMVGGLVLVFKQTGQIAIMIRLALFALAIAATDKIAEWNVVARIVAHIMPITDAAICLKYVLIQGQKIDGRFCSVFWHPSGAFWFLLGNCLFWTLFGILCFRVMENWSRSKGTLGAY
ncbi:MAG TPA: hypothetical protein PLO37_05230 [Candidatus Hydrogenedentes bacterium]|nr:hypothetical protein [Candidatus Hydrogenedentota bacterium]HPG66228.1 hypothetical protein [Candidatus Hydrogenedentota bacterium]